MEQYDDLFARVEQLEKMGGFNEAIKVLTLMKEILPGAINWINLEILKIKYNHKLYEEALYESLTYLSDDDDVIWQWLVDKYILPYKDEHQRIKKRNLELLRQYKFVYKTALVKHVDVIYYNANGNLVVREGSEIIVYSDDFSYDMDEPAIIVNPLSINKLLELKRKTEYLGSMPNYMNPIYIYYDEEVFAALVQSIDFEELINNDRVIIFAGEQSLESFFMDTQVVNPITIIGYKESRDKISYIIEEIIKRKSEAFRENIIQIQKYYQQDSSKIYERIISGKPRIMFFTSYFTTVLKYHTRDCKDAVEKMGLDTELLIEKGPIFRLSKQYVAETIARFHPDVIFNIDHFRFEYEIWPKELVWISWLQDFLPNIMDHATPAKLGERDFIMTHFTTWYEFRQIGYRKDRIIEAAIPASSDVYKVYDMSEEEYNSYKCDVCFVCHCSDVDAYIQQLIDDNQFDSVLAEMLYTIYKGYQNYVYETGDIFYTLNLFKEFISGCMYQVYHTNIKPYHLEVLAEDMRNNFNQRVYRQALVDWILDAGFTNIKLWGNGWMDNEKYQAYAMGPAENGETLSKIYQASKIVIGNNVMTSAAARAWETMLSGGFYLSNYIPEEEDVTDIRKIIEVGKDVIMFYGKDDLLEKIHYYLEHEEERQMMIQRGRKAALENMTFDILMKRTLSEVAKRLEENDNG